MIGSFRRLWSGIRYWHNRIETMWPPQFLSAPPDGTRIRQVMMDCPRRGIVEVYLVGSEVALIASGYASDQAILVFGYREKVVRIAPGSKFVAEYVNAEEPGTEPQGHVAFYDGKVQCFGLSQLNDCPLHGGPPSRTGCFDAPLPASPPKPPPPRPRRPAGIPAELTPQ